VSDTRHADLRLVIPRANSQEATFGASGVISRAPPR
jgi:hypothetical protein